MTISFEVYELWFLRFSGLFYNWAYLENDKDKHNADWQVAEGKTGTANLLGLVWTGKSWQ